MCRLSEEQSKNFAVQKSIQECRFHCLVLSSAHTWTSFVFVDKVEIERSPKHNVFLWLVRNEGIPYRDYSDGLYREDSHRSLTASNVLGGMLLE